ncbi:hypothetical protein SAMN05443247_05152 [Bradyrhizobium erythrophlei]|nr:hypothetical protein SAMN05443247_05152 [Bradyrhizobium erythrophlei]
MPEIFTIGFSEDAFVAAVAGAMATPGITPLAAASRCFSGSLLDGLTRTMGQRLVKDPTVSQGTWPARYETLADLAAMVEYDRAEAGQAGIGPAGGTMRLRIGDVGLRQRRPSPQSVRDSSEKRGRKHLSLSETQSCWPLISNRAMLLPYARGL